MTNDANKHDTSPIQVIHNTHNNHDMHDMTCHDNEHEHVHDYTEPGVFQYPTDAELVEICEMYKIVTGRELNSITARMIEEWFERVEPALIVQALERTGRYARRPCAEYAVAILRNWDKAGVHSMAELQSSETRRRQEKAFGQSMQRGWWNQQRDPSRGQERSYTEADFEGIYYDPAKDYSSTAHNFTERRYTEEESKAVYFDLEKFYGEKTD